MHESANKLFSYISWIVIVDFQKDHEVVGSAIVAFL